MFEDLPEGFTLIEEKPEAPSLPSGFVLLDDVAAPNASPSPSPSPNPSPAPSNITPPAMAQSPLSGFAPAPMEAEAQTSDSPSLQQVRGQRGQAIAGALSNSVSPMRGIAAVFGKGSEFGKLSEGQQQSFILKEINAAQKQIEDASKRLSDARHDNSTSKVSPNSFVGFTREDKTSLSRSEAEGRLKRAQERLKQAYDIVNGESLAPQYGPVKNALAGAVKSFANAFGEALPKAAGAIQATVTGQNPEETALYGVGETFGATTDSLLHTDRARGHTTTQQVAEGLGQAASFLTPAAGLKAVGVGGKATQGVTYGLGAAQSGAQGLDEAISFDADTSKQLTSFWANSALGVSEAVPINRLLSRLNTSTGGQVQRIIKNSAAQGGEELLQEVAQTIGSNVIASELAKYDEGRSILEGTKEAGTVGGIVGAILGGGTTAFSRGNPNEATNQTPQTTDGHQERPVIRARSLGKSKVTDQSGKPLNVEYAVVEADDLIASNKPDLSINPDFPTELQPRERSRSASETQINNIASNIIPEWLGKTPFADQGAPIIGQDGIVESGNARAIGLQRVYQEGGESEQKYRQFLKDEKINTRGYKKPVLVRIGEAGRTQEERARFTRTANAPSTASMSVTERALADAQSLTPQDFDLAKSAGTSTIANVPFVRQILTKTTTEAERGQLIDAKGRLSVDGKRRVEAAIAAYAYEDSRVLSNLIETTDKTLRSIGDVMINVAPQWAQLKADIKAGRVDPRTDIIPNIIEAANIITDARLEGGTAQQRIDLIKSDMFNESGNISEETQAILRMFYDGDTAKQRDPKQIVEDLNYYAQEALKVQSGPDIFGDRESDAPANRILSAIAEKRGTVTQRTVDDDFSNAPIQDKVFLKRTESKPKTATKALPEGFKLLGADAPPKGFKLVSRDDSVLETHTGKLTGGRRREGATSTPKGDVVGKGNKDAVALHDLTEKLSKSLGLTVRQGRISQGKSTLGIYKLRDGVIRLRESYRAEMEVFSHEGGHALEKKIGRPLQDLMKSFAFELRPMAYEGANPKYVLEEGFAEFFRTYVTNPSYAKNNAPKFFEKFERLIADERPAIASDLREIQKAYEAFVKAPSSASIAADIVITGGKSNLKKTLGEIKSQGPKAYASNLANRVYTAVVDKHHPFTTAVKRLKVLYEQNTGEKINLAVARDPAKLLRLALDSTSGGHMDLMHGVRPYRSTEAKGPALADAIETSLGSRGSWSETQLADFGAYLVARRAIHEWERYNKGEIPNPPTKHSLDDHRKAKEEYEGANPEWKKASSQVYEWTQNLWRKKYDAGLITKEQFEEGKQLKDYVPFKRDIDDKDITSALLNGTGRKGKASVVKRFQGSQRAIINPLETLMADAYTTARTIARNDVLLSLANLADAAGAGAGAIVERLPEKTIKGSSVDAAQAVYSAAVKNGLSSEDARNLKASIEDLFDGDTVTTLFKATGINEAGEPIVFMWDKGKRIPLRIGDKNNAMDIYGIFTGLNEEQKQLFIDAAALPTTVLRYGITTSPDFLFANYIRDQLSAWILTDIKFKPFIDGAAYTYKEIAQKDITRLYNSFGGIMGGGNVAALNIGTVNKDINALRNKGHKVRRFASWKGFSRLTEVTETGTRLAIFSRQIEDAKRRGLSDYDATLEAAFESRDYIDFGRHGSRMLAARRLATFLNAAIQGLDKSFRVLTNDGKLLKTAMPYLIHRLQKKAAPMSKQEQRRVEIAAKAWAKVSTIGVLGLALSALYEDDPEYEEFSEYTRATHWVIKSPSGQWYVIPKPFELAFMSNLFERSYERYKNDDPLAMERLRGGLGEVFIPPHNVPAINVPYEMWANKKTFNGAPIVPTHMQRLEPSLQFTAYTSNFSKKLGEKLNYSPARIDHMINSVFGSWGRNALSVSEALNDEAPATNTTSTPIIRRFAKSPYNGSLSRTETYKLLNRSDGHWTIKAATLKKYIESGESQKAKDYLRDMSALEREFALANATGSVATKRLHPLRRAYDAQNVANTMKKELLTGSLKDAKGRPIPVTREKKREAVDALSRLTVAYTRNALIEIEYTGWKGKPRMDEEQITKEIGEVSTVIENALRARLIKKKVAPLSNVSGNYKTLQSQSKALSDKMEKKAAEQAKLNQR